jgi:pimeloyl-ACP methyl ester carboxylesterase
MEKSRHFPMLDEPEKFMQTLNAFLSNDTDIERRV